MSEAADKLKAEIAKYGKSKRLWYREVYLYSDHWKALRGAKFSQAGRICDKCKDTERLQIHHLRYRSIYDVKLTDLQVLCVTCHHAEHPDKKPQKAKKAKAPKVKKQKAATKSTPPFIPSAPPDLPWDVIVLYDQFAVQSPRGSKTQQNSWILNRVMETLRKRKVLTEALRLQLMSRKKGKKAREAKRLLKQPQA